MTSCTIIISHYESLPFLRACVRQIEKYEHPQIYQQVFIIDQSGPETFDDLLNEYSGEKDMAIKWVRPLYSGYAIDYVMQNIGIGTDYICQLHVDAFPIHRNWLYLPIKLIEENNFSFVGQLHFINRNASIYPPNPFFSMSPTFNVARTKTYKEMSFEAGFTRFHNRIDSGMEFANSDWADWAQVDYFKRGSDDDTVAFHWEDTHREHNKLGLAITAMIEKGYGRIIEDIVFHFGSCREAIGVMDVMPAMYKAFTKRINENYTDELIREMVVLAKSNTRSANGSETLVRNVWDGKTKTVAPPSPELNKRIEELKK